MSLMNSISRFARSAQGKRAAQQAMQYANSPDAKRKLAQLRQQVAARGRKPSR